MSEQKPRDWRERKEECEICGKAGSRFVMLGPKGSNNADFYWICEHCEKAIRWLFARIDESDEIEEDNDEEVQILPDDL